MNWKYDGPSRLIISQTEEDSSVLEFLCPFCGSPCRVEFEDRYIIGRLNVWRDCVDVSGCEHLRGANGRFRICWLDERGPDG